MPPARSKGEPDLVVILDSFIGTLRLDARAHLELADQEHVLVHSDQGVAVGFSFYVLVVLVKGNFGKRKATGFAFFCGFYDL